MAVASRASYRVFLSTPFTANNLNSTSSIFIVKPGAGGALFELTPVSMEFGWGLNKAGAARVSALKRTSSRPLQLWGIEPGRTSLWIQRGSRVVWGGLVWDLSTKGGDNKIEFTCEEFPSYFAKVRMDWEFGSTAQGTINIMQILVGDAGLRGALPFPVVVDGGVAGYIYNPIWYEYEDRFVLDLVKELQSIGQHQTEVGVIPVTPTEGFEWCQRIVHNEPGDIESSDIGAVWYVVAPTIGEQRNFPVVEWGPGTRETAHELSWTRSARSMANRVKVKGMGSRGEQQRATVTWPGGAPSGHPRFDAVFSDSKLGFNDQVVARGRDLLLKLASPQLQVKATMIPGADFPWPDYLQFPTIQVGDRLPVRIMDYDIEIADNLRVTSMDVSVQSSGVETVQLGLQPWIPGATNA